MAGNMRTLPVVLTVEVAKGLRRSGHGTEKGLERVDMTRSGHQKKGGRWRHFRKMFSCRDTMNANYEAFLTCKEMKDCRRSQNI